MRCRLPGRRCARTAGRSARSDSRPGLACAAQVAGRSALDPGAVHADVDLDQHIGAGTGSGERGGHRLGRLVRVNGDREVGRAGHLGQAPPRLRPEDGVVQKQRPELVAGHHLGLADLRDREPRRARGELHSRDGRHLVRLGVRPERDAVLTRVAREPRDVGLHPVEVDHRDRRGQLTDGQADPCIPLCRRLEHGGDATRPS